jgi:hypothetical protein
MTEPPLRGVLGSLSVPHLFSRRTPGVRTPYRPRRSGLSRPRVPSSRTGDRLRCRPSVPSSPHRGLRLRCIRGRARLRIDPC